jgi:hypothetical protein
MASKQTPTVIWADASGVHDLKQSLDRHLSINDDALSLLKPVETDPIGLLHTTIFKFHEHLRRALVDEQPYTRLLLDVQGKLKESLTATLPVFLPFFEDNDNAAGTYEVPKVQEWSGEGSKNFIYLDEVLSTVQQ